MPQTTIKKGPHQFSLPNHGRWAQYTTLTMEG